MRGSMVGAILVALVALGLTTTAARAQARYSITCPEGRVLTGIRGWQGWWMDGIQGVCANVSSSGAIISSDVSLTSRAGGTGTGGSTRSEYRCPSGKVLTGWKGTKGSYVNTMHRIQCQPFDAGTRRAVSSPTEHNAFSYKSGDAISGSCSSGEVGRGFTGYAGLFLDSTRLSCGYAISSTSSGSSGSSLKRPPITKLPR